MARNSIPRRVGFAFTVAACVAGASGPVDSVVLENDFARILAVPEKGGAISSMIFKKATNFPFIADKDGGLAGSGVLFAARLSIDGRVFDLAGVPLQAGKSGGRAVKLTGSVAGLVFERTIAMDERESGFRITDTIRNDAAGAREIHLKVGATSSQQEDRWRAQQRSWFGEPNEPTRQVSSEKPGTQELELQSTKMFWRVIGQYGVGFLYEADSPTQPVRLTSVGKNRGGDPIRFEWLGSERASAGGR